jgi:hypothetical protein
MKKLNPSLLLAGAISLCASSALAQGTMQATWANYNGPWDNTFQASFQIHASDMAPGTDISATDLFKQTLTVTSPDHAFQAAGNPDARCGYSPDYGPFSSSLYVNNGDLILDAVIRDPANPAFTIVLGGTTIGEWVNGTLTYGESGSWLFAPVPEPSSAALLALGLLALVNKNGIASGNGLAPTPANATTSLP